jgi:hypothetical protein
VQNQPAALLVLHFFITSTGTLEENRSEKTPKFVNLGNSGKFLLTLRQEIGINELVKACLLIPFISSEEEKRDEEG